MKIFFRILKDSAINAKCFIRKTLCATNNGNVKSRLSIVVFLLLIYSCSTKDIEIKSTIKSVKTGHPISLSKAIDSVELEGLEYESLRLLRNEIFARKGYRFKTKELAAYFSQFEWYQSRLDANLIKEKLTEIDRGNIELIKSLENQQNKEIGWNKEMQEFLNLIPVISLPLNFICDSGFTGARIPQANEVLIEYLPENAQFVGKLYQDPQEAAIIYGFDADIFFPIILKIDNKGNKIEQINIFGDTECESEDGKESFTIGRITKDFKIETKVTKVVFYENDYAERNDTTVTIYNKNVK